MMCSKRNILKCKKEKNNKNLTFPKDLISDKHIFHTFKENMLALLDQLNYNSNHMLKNKEKVYANWGKH